MKEKAIKQGVNNLFVMDGSLDSIPLPDDSLDVLITSNAIGWHLKKELKEIERVVKSEGYAIHLLHADPEHADPFREILTSPQWDYQFSQEMSGKTKKIRYYKQIL
jgi:ubiquinone/menaquinone biosynthesis C-methylase UbiE